MSKPSPSISALKIWLTGLLLGPVFLAIGSAVYNVVNKGETDFDNFGNLLSVWALMILYGGFFSLPSLLVLWLTLFIMRRLKQSEPVFWTTILSITFLLTITPFAILLGDEMGFLSGMSLAYLGGIWLGVFWAFYWPAGSTEQSIEEPLDTNL